jgi:hypothetical protein
MVGVVVSRTRESQYEGRPSSAAAAVLEGKKAGWRGSQSTELELAGGKKRPPKVTPVTWLRHRCGCPAEFQHYVLSLLLFSQIFSYYCYENAKPHSTPSDGPWETIG